MRIDGADTVLDFTHVTDVVEALKRAIQHLFAGRPPLQTPQFVSGRGTSLEALAKMAIESAGRGSFAGEQDSVLVAVEGGRVDGVPRTRRS